MPYADVGQPEHWTLLLAFFVLFAVHGLWRKPASPYPGIVCLMLGTGAVLLNAGLLLAANHLGYGSYPLLELLTLRQAALESSLIIVGYCIIVRGLCVFIRYMATPDPEKGGRTIL
ncbi:MAG: hypothetical protein GWO16_12025 [Gammaproteobacteria bacterium]|nr:hypothetical protein [Gammaproteobacteria bacterium]NIR98658.1 hypothetical protein [Gammaproteobacteria bacterium]NIT64372.1 hypothetical protein [Gammaproteobacteria bacterium]NIV21304.1 hypothetical protein [Gammaproteobacteria bacterium]NIX11062.1 hypothetical protein [Gammaproteobacteria bacterium]